MAWVAVASAWVAVTSAGPYGRGFVQQATEAASIEDRGAAPGAAVVAGAASVEVRGGAPGAAALAGAEEEEMRGASVALADVVLDAAVPEGGGSTAPSVLREAAGGDAPGAPPTLPGDVNDAWHDKRPCSPLP